MKIVAISGSLRKDSLNTRLLEAARACFPEGTVVELCPIDDLPLYNQDLDGEQKPAGVNRFRQAVDEADGLLIATPEYNYGIPGGLKNAIDWASRPAYQSPFVKKPVAVLSASMSPVGGARVQGQLKQVLLGVLADVFNAPEFLLPSAHQAFAADGQLQDADALRRLQRFATDFSAHITAVKSRR